jgi:type I restriction enzyme R subunit
MLTTGVDVPTCKNVVLVRVIGCMSEFKQIIGRGTRVRDDYGKLAFSILDYTGSATCMFADPEFDGEPIVTTEVQVDDEGDPIPGTEDVTEETDLADDGDGSPEGTSDDQGQDGDGDGEDGQDDDDEGVNGSRKYHVDGGAGEVATELWTPTATSSGWC